MMAIANPLKHRSVWAPGGLDVFAAYANVVGGSRDSMRRSIYHRARRFHIMDFDECLSKVDKKRKEWQQQQPNWTIFVGCEQ